MESPADSLDIVTVHNDGVPPESGHPGTIDLHIVLEGGRLALSQTVHVDDSNQIVKFVVAGEGGSLPDATLGTLTVPHHTVDTVAGVVKGEREGKYVMQDNKSIILGWCD